MKKSFSNYKFAAYMIAFSILLTGCSNKNANAITNVKLTEREKIISSFWGDMCTLFDFMFNDTIGGMSLCLEEWVAGERLKEDIISYGGTSDYESLYVISNLIKDDDIEGPGVEWKFITVNKEARITLGTHKFYFPDKKNWIGSTHSILSENGEEKIKVEPGEEYILVARLFDLNGDELKLGSIDTQNMQEDILKSCDYAIVLRLHLYQSEEEVNNLIESTK
jgi:hypothetical protein